MISGGNDILAHSLELSGNDTIYFFQVGSFLFAVIAFFVTKRLSLSIQRRKRAEVLHGVETSRTIRRGTGDVVESHEPLNEHDDFRPLKAGNGVSKLRAAATSFFFKDRIEPVTPAELREAFEHAAHEKETVDRVTDGDYSTPAEQLLDHHV